MYAQDQCTPLHVACAKGQAQILPILIQSGATLDVQDKVRDRGNQEDLIAQVNPSVRGINLLAYDTSVFPRAAQEDYP